MTSVIMITFFLTPDSRTYFGFQWAGWFCTNNSIPFGWKSSAYVYHSIGLLASHYFRSLLIPCSLYIDDRHTGEIQLSDDTPADAHLLSNRDRAFARACSAVFLVCHTLLALGYFWGLKKSSLIARQVVSYLGFHVDSVQQAFLLIANKRASFFLWSAISFVLARLMSRTFNVYPENAFSFPLRSRLLVYS